MSVDEIDLLDIIEKYPYCLDDSTKLRGIIIDLYPGISKGIVHALCAVLTSGIANEIQNKNVTIDDFDKHKWLKKLEDDWCMSGKTIESCLDLWIDVIKTINSPTRKYAKKKSSEGFVFTEDSKGICLTGLGVCVDNDVVVPSLIDNKIVVSIAEKAFSNGKFASIYIPHSICSIGRFAFSMCNNLQQIIFDGTCKEWGEVYKGASFFKDESRNKVFCLKDMRLFNSCADIATTQKPVDPADLSRYKSSYYEPFHDYSTGYSDQRLTLEDQIKSRFAYEKAHKHDIYDDDFYDSTHYRDKYGIDDETDDGYFDDSDYDE